MHRISSIRKTRATPNLSLSLSLSIDRCHSSIMVETVSSLGFSSVEHFWICLSIINVIIIIIVVVVGDSVIIVLRVLSIAVF